MIGRELTWEDLERALSQAARDGAAFVWCPGAATARHEAAVAEEGRLIELLFGDPLR